MAEVVYIGPTVQIVPELTAQDDIGGTLILRPGQHYDFAGDPPGDPSWWRTGVPPLPPALPAVPPVPSSTPAQEG